MPEMSKNINGKKFMWDGKSYGCENEAMMIESGYQEKDFETSILEEEDKYLVYTRRVVTEIILDGEAPL